MLSFVDPKIISSTYICTMSKSSFLVLVNKVVSIFPLVNHFSKRNPLSLSYHALGAYFKPYKALVNLKTLFGNS